MVDQSPLKNDAGLHYIQALHEEHIRAAEKHALSWKRLTIVGGVMVVITTVAACVHMWITW